MMMMTQNCAQHSNRVSDISLNKIEKKQKIRSPFNQKRTTCILAFYCSDLDLDPMTLIYQFMVSVNKM